MEKVISIEINEEIMDYLQMIHYEYLSYKKILEDIIILKRDYKHNEETYKIFMSEYKEAYTKFELCKNSVLEKYCNDYIGPEYKYEFDFIGRTLHIMKG